MKRFKRGEKGFTLVELLIVVAILGILAAVVIPNVVGLMGRGGAQAYETDQEVIQLAASTFYADVHSGFALGVDGLTGTPATYLDNTWGANQTTEDAGHYYPTAIAAVSGHVLRLGTDTDPANPGNFVIESDVAGTDAVDADIRDHAIWTGLLTNAPGTGVVDDAAGLLNRGTTSVLLTENGLYLQEVPESAAADTAVGNDRNGADPPGGGYTWVVGLNGTVYGAYQDSVTNIWYNGFSGAYP
jgi:type IV pilus assembly protein PilA